MLAASVDGVDAIQLLLKHGATIELQVEAPKILIFLLLFALSFPAETSAHIVPCADNACH